MNINYDNPFNFKPIPTITPASSYWENDTWKFNMPEITVGTGVSPSWVDIILSGNTALTLVNSKANGLNYLKLFGGTEQRNLPSGYTQVEYLESSGTQYIDTGVKPNGNYTVIVKGKYNNLGNGVNKLYGSRTNAGSKEFIFTAATPDGQKFNIGYGTNIIDVTGIFSDTNVHIFKLSKGIGYVDNTVVQEFAQQNFEGDYSLYLFGANYAGTANGLSDTRIYYEEIYNGNDTLIQNLIPCRRNSDSVLGMYDTVTDTFLTNAGTGTFTAGPDAVPSPDTPIDIVCNNGVVKVSPNLFDYEYFYDNYVQPTQSTVGRVAIKLLPNTNYTVSTNTQQSSNSAQVWVGSGNDPSGFTPNTGTNGALINSPRTVQSDSNGYIVLAIRVGSDYKIEESDFANGTVWIQVEQGSTATPYMPYGQIYTDGTVETVTVTGKNLFDVDNNLLEGYYIVINTGNLAKSSDGSSSCFKDFLPSRPNVTYTMSRINRVSGTAMRMWAYDKDKNPISLVFNSTTEDIEVTGTTPNGTAYIRCSFGSIPNYSQNIQLEQGSTATTYEPYYYGGSANAEMLLKVGDYKDIQEVLGGNVTKNVGIKVLDGTEEWGTSTKYCWNLLSETRTTLNAYCTHFKMEDTIPPSSSGSSVRWGKMFASSFGLAIGARASSASEVSDTVFLNVDDWKNYITSQYTNGTPVIIVYPTSSPVIEQVAPQSLTIQQGTNIIEITEASMDNLPLEVSYKAGVAVTITEVQNAQLDNNVEVTING